MDNLPAPSPRPARRRHRVGVVICPQHSLGSVGLVLDVFRMANQLPGPHRFDIVRVSEDGAPVNHPDGSLKVEGGPELLSDTELVVLPSLWTQGLQAAASHPRVIAALQRLRPSVRVATLCTGVYLLAATGRLDGQAATTHWMLAEELQERHPLVRVQPAHNLTQAGGLVCSGGSLAGVDACLHAVQALSDRETAQALARMLVTDLDRGPQTLYMPPPGWRRHADVGIRGLQDRLEASCAQPLSLQELAAALHVSVRTLQRRFLAATGTTPIQYQQALRLAHARTLLETGRLPVAEVAAEVGYADRVAFGRLFKRHTGLTPAAWRQKHSAAPVAG